MSNNNRNKFPSPPPGESKRGDSPGEKVIHKSTRTGGLASRRLVVEEERRHSTSSLSAKTEAFVVNPETFPVREVSNRELKIAFDFLDVNGEGVVSLQSIKKRLGAIFGGTDRVPMNELKFLMGNKKGLTLKQIRKILDETSQVLEHANIDPLREAFSVYDPDNTGFADPGKISGLIERLGYGCISDEDMKVLIETIDADGDGRIGLADFAKMLEGEGKRVPTFEKI